MVLLEPWGVVVDVGCREVPVWLSHPCPGWRFSTCSRFRETFLSFGFNRFHLVGIAVKSPQTWRAASHWCVSEVIRLWSVLKRPAVRDIRFCVVHPEDPTSSHRRLCGWSSRLLERLCPCLMHQSVARMMISIDCNWLPLIRSWRGRKGRRHRRLHFFLIAVVAASRCRAFKR